MAKNSFVESHGKWLIFRKRVLYFSPYVSLNWHKTRSMEHLIRIEFTELACKPILLTMENAQGIFYCWI